MQEDLSYHLLAYAIACSDNSASEGSLYILAVVLYMNEALFPVEALPLVLYMGHMLASPMKIAGSTVFM